MLGYWNTGILEYWNIGIMEKIFYTPKHKAKQRLAIREVS
jgi:hypothetical protein